LDTHAVTNTDASAKRINNPKVTQKYVTATLADIDPSTQNPATPGMTMKATTPYTEPRPPSVFSTRSTVWRLYIRVIW